MLSRLRALSAFCLRLPLVFATQLLTTSPALAQQNPHSEFVTGWCGFVSIGPALVPDYPARNFSEMAPFLLGGLR